MKVRFTDDAGGALADRPRPASREADDPQRLVTVAAKPTGWAGRGARSRETSHLMAGLTSLPLARLSCMTGPFTPDVFLESARDFALTALTLTATTSTATSPSTPGQRLSISPRRVWRAGHQHC